MEYHSDVPQARLCGTIKLTINFFVTHVTIIVPMTPIIAFERLFFAVFGQTSPDDINSQRNSRPEWTENLFKLVYGIYMLVSVIVLINLLIAMMSDTYQRIQVITTSFLFYFLSVVIQPVNHIPPTVNNYRMHENPLKILAYNQSE